MPLPCRCRLYGTRWCLNCRQQKAMLYQLTDRSGWKDMYVDCDLLLNSLETAYIKQVSTSSNSWSWICRARFNLSH